MAITVYTGVPGSGKSYTMIEQLLVPAIIKGRRVVTNIAGIKPEKVYELCQKKAPAADLGEVVLFESKQSLKPNFWPTEETGDDNTFIKGGDLILFDEWRLTFEKRGKLPTADLEPFLRYHRHFTDAAGAATDVAIGTQVHTDVHMDFRGLIERSYKFHKLKAIGAPKFYRWDMYEGSTQPKGEGVSKGNGKYKKEIFDLYSSYDTEAQGKELATDSRTSIWSTSLISMIVGVVLMFCVAGWGVAHFFAAPDAIQPGQTMPSPSYAAAGVPAAIPGVMPRPRSPYRIVGHVVADNGTRIVLADDKGSVRIVSADGFDFDGDRPTYGVLDGQAVVADDRIIITPAGAPAPQFGLPTP